MTIPQQRPSCLSLVSIDVCGIALMMYYTDVTDVVIIVHSTSNISTVIEKHVNLNLHVSDIVCFLCYSAIEMPAIIIEWMRLISTNTCRGVYRN